MMLELSKPLPFSPVSAKVLLLLSGGYDSPISGYILKQLGFRVLAVHFSQEPFTDASHEEKALTLATMFNFTPFYVVNIGNQLLHITETCQPRQYFVLMKRLMYRLATNIAQLEGAEFLASGDSLGQVSSQTLSNMTIIDEALTTVPILRPLLSYSKMEIIDISRRIGTFEISSGPESCDRLGPKHPETHAKLVKVLNEEKLLDLPELMTNALSTVKKISLINDERTQLQQIISVP